MRILCFFMVVFFTAAGLLRAEENSYPAHSGVDIAKLIYQDGYLVNKGEEVLLNVEIIEPFYRYFGSIQRNASVDVSYMRTKFTVQYTARQWIGVNETMKQTFIPRLKNPELDIGLDVESHLNRNMLRIIVTSDRKITDIFIEALPDIPVKISDERVRYVLSSVGIEGQNLKKGPIANFKLCLLLDKEFYRIPVQVTYVYEGVCYDKVFFFAFKRQDFEDEAPFA